MRSLTNILLGGVLTASMLTGGCGYNKVKVETVNTARLAVDDCTPVTRAFRYNGMPNDKVFSISRPYTSRDAANTFYASDSKKFKFSGVNYDILSVTPDSLIVQYKK